MQDQRAMLEDEHSQMREKLQHARAHAQALKQCAAEHGLDEPHYQHDLMKAENDAQYYEAEIGRLGEALSATPAGGKTGGGIPYLGELGGVSVAAACVAFGAGVLLGWALLPPRGGR